MHRNAEYFINVTFLLFWRIIIHMSCVWVFSYLSTKERMRDLIFMVYETIWRSNNGAQNHISTQCCCSYIKCLFTLLVGYLKRSWKVNIRKTLHFEVKHLRPKLSYLSISFSTNFLKCSHGWMFVAVMSCSINTVYQ